MIRRFAFVLITTLLVVGAWLLLRHGDNEPVPNAHIDSAPVAAGPPAELQAANVANSATPVAPAAAAVERSAATSDSDQPPIPADAKWYDVLVVDAVSQQPVPDAEVHSSDSAVYKVVQALPEADRRPYQNDSELLLRRFGRHTRSDAAGIARIATDGTAAMLYAYAEGRFATGRVGGQLPVPPGGWRLELERDCTLRAQVLDFAGQPAFGVQVAVLLPAQEGQSPAHSGRYQRTLTTPPDGIAEFRHIQLWGRGGGKSQPGINTWRVATDLPGGDDPGVAFENLSPPKEPIVLQLPATGRLIARLLHAGQPIRENVSFCAHRGAANDTDSWNRSARVEIDADGWARFPHVPLGGTLTVMAWFGTGYLHGATPGPTGNGQEVRVELTTDGLYALAGRLLGPDGKVLAKARVNTDFDLEITSGGGQLTTDAEGRFLWLLGKGLGETAKLKRLVLSQTPAEGPPLRAAVAPREMVRGVNQLGDIPLSPGTLVVAGRFEIDPPDSKLQVPVSVQRLSDRRGRNGAENWEELRGTTPVQRPDGTFEVRGDSVAGRHRLRFRSQNHLPVEPFEFPLGKADLSIPIVIGHALAANCLLPAELPPQQLRGVLLLSAETPTATVPKPASDLHDFDRMDFDRYTARAWGPSADAVDLRWQALPPGTYTLEIRTTGAKQAVATIPDVVLPPPAGGDPRLKDIDLRDKLGVRKVRVTLLPRSEDADEDLDPAAVFTMPQDDPTLWHGSQVRGGEAVIAAPLGPIELCIACSGFQPKRIVTAEREITVALEPWPQVEFTFADLPLLPAGMALHASLREANKSREPARREYRTDNRGGGLDGLLQPESPDAAVSEGRARVPIGDGTFRVSVYLLRTEGENSRSKFLRKFTPLEIQGGSNLAPIAIQLDAAELQHAIDELQQPPAKK